MQILFCRPCALLSENMESVVQAISFLRIESRFISRSPCSRICPRDASDLHTDADWSAKVCLLEGSFMYFRDTSFHFVDYMASCAVSECSPRAGLRQPHRTSPNSGRSGLLTRRLQPLPVQFFSCGGAATCCTHFRGGWFVSVAVLWVLCFGNLARTASRSCISRVWMKDAAATGSVLFLWWCCHMLYTFFVEVAFDCCGVVGVLLLAISPIRRVVVDRRGC